MLHIAQCYPGPFPAEANVRARATQWMFGALNTVEPPSLELTIVRLLEGDMPWAVGRTPFSADRHRGPLGQLAHHIGNAGWLHGAFNTGDVMLVSVLLRFRAWRMLDDYAHPSTYFHRGQARPAYRRAFAAQLAAFSPLRAAFTSLPRWMASTT